MKKILALLLAMTILLLAGCNGNTPVETVPATTEAPVETTVATEPEPTETEPPVPETISGTVQADKTAVVLTTVNRGDEVDIAGEYDEEYFVVKLETGYGLIEKRLVRLEGEESYESWEGYAKYGALLYPTYYLRASEGEPLNLNTRILVLEDLGEILVVQMEETVGYMPKDMVSPNYIQPYSGGGGSQDGGDISLGFRGGVTVLSTFVPQEGEVSGKATVLADGAEILLGWFDRNEEVRIVTEAGFAEEKEGFRTVYLEGLYGYIRQVFLLEEGQEPYAEWTGYAVNSPKLYDNFNLSGEGVSLSNNAELQILADLGDCYLVTSGETTGYMAKDTVSEVPVVYSGWSGGGGGGEWTPPAM